jgi:predicted 2-oxoglutarate/Fe(II)-dependent dioxygenase YbiX
MPRQAVEIEAKYDITAKAKASAANVMASARELEEKHQVTTKVGNALGKGLDRLSAFLGACLLRVCRARYRLYCCGCTFADALLTCAVADSKPGSGGTVAASSLAPPSALPSVPR